jgi:hypothetical protein
MNVVLFKQIRFPSVLACAAVLFAGPVARAWTTPVGSVHKACAEVALDDPACAAFVAYLGIDPEAIASYAQTYEPWVGDWRQHVSFWSMIAPEGNGVRYVNDTGYIGNSHNRTGMWPGAFDRSVDVLGALLHSAGDSAVIMGHSPGNDWYTNSAYEARFELAGNNRSGTAWDPPSLVFDSGQWPRHVYTGTPDSEAHKLYLDTYANFAWWDQNLSELDKTLGSSKLDDAAERAAKTGKRWAIAVLRDFLVTQVLKDPAVSISCNEVAGASFTVNSDAVLSFHYTASGDRQSTVLEIGGAVTDLGPADPLSLDAAGDTTGRTFAAVGPGQASITAGHDFFGLNKSASAAVAINVVQHPVAKVTTDATDSDNDAVPDYDLLTESPPTILEQSSGEIEHRTVEVKDAVGTVLGTWSDQTTIAWTFGDVRLYTITTTVTNSHYGPNTDTDFVQLKIINGIPAPDAGFDGSILSDTPNPSDVSYPSDGSQDAADSGTADAEAPDASADSGEDTGSADTGTTDSGQIDTGLADATVDTGVISDGGPAPSDSGARDGSTKDDAGPPPHADAVETGDSGDAADHAVGGCSCSIVGI